MSLLDREKWPRPRVSVITPTLNRSALLRRTVQSVLDQEFTSWEMIVVDDGSSDDTASLMMEFCKRDSRIRFLSREGFTHGAAACRNQGVAQALGDYVFYLDSDDLLVVGCLAGRVAAMEENPSLDFSVFLSELFSKEPGDCKKWLNVIKNENDLDRFLAMDVPWFGGAVLWKRESLKRVGPWDEELLILQDWDYSLRAMAEGLRYAWFPQRDIYYRKGHGDTISERCCKPQYLMNQTVLLGKLGPLLRKASVMNARRGAALYRLCFFTAHRLADQRCFVSSFWMWVFAFRSGWIGPFRWLGGLCFLVLARIFRTSALKNKIKSAACGYRLPFSNTLFTVSTEMSPVPDSCQGMVMLPRNLKNPGERVAGVVVLFHPQEHEWNRIRSYADSLECLYAIDNTPQPDPYILAVLKKYPSIRYFHNPENQGISGALNRVVPMAREDGFSWLLTMDQDGGFASGDFDLFMKCFHNLSSKEKVAIVTPVHFGRLRTGYPAGAIEKPYVVMTVGNLLNLEAFTIIGGFDPRYFIDAVDTEYCLRAWKKGFEVVRFLGIPVEHDFGQKEIIMRGGRSRMLACQHSPGRYYYMVRNHLLLYSEYLFVYPKFVLTHGLAFADMMIRALLIENHRRAKARQMVRGMMDFFLRRYGYRVPLAQASVGKGQA